MRWRYIKPTRLIEWNAHVEQGSLMTFGGFCFTETKERELMFACTRTSYHPCIQSNVPMCIMGGWMGCWGVYICKCLAQIRRRHREEMLLGCWVHVRILQWQLTWICHYTTQNTKRNQQTWRFGKSFHCQIQLTLKAPIPLDSQHDAMTPIVRMTDYYFQHVYYFITRVCALTHTGTPSFVSLYPRVEMHVLWCYQQNSGCW